MDKLVAVVFRDEERAYKGVTALSEMNADGSVDVAMVCLIKKEPDGSTSTKEVNDGFPIRTLAGTALGAVAGLVAAGVGAAVGAGAGLLAGLIGDLYSAGVDQDFVSDVATALTPGKCAVVAEVDEESLTPLDMRMEALDGVVYRTLKSSVQEEHWNRDTDNARAQLSQLKSEFAQARADRKAKLEAQIERLKKRIDAKLARAQARSQQMTREYEAKVQALRDKADKQKGEAKGAIEARIAKLRKDYQNRTCV
jgi:uncharacterized membrane protein